MHVMELVKWQSQNNVLDIDMVNAVDGILPDLEKLPGFISQVLYKDSNGTWVDIYLWKTEEQAIASNDLMADKQSFIKLMSLLKPETVSIEFLYPTTQS
ncbi:hypothetical protein F9L33_15055 [Amylibacter sp. SFDW26]|uniref:hypothetical protein n=1 Tax=Amylibacter sp. SFDW26 TaxID=2652722 RepID=UPI001261646C|nr:hypothetical protein [Amylibacter sp. SFDW26]KAB7610209.1 hypothetical protein F9L33_15055 [Amylibacter sp. SFDW26]